VIALAGGVALVFGGPWELTSEERAAAPPAVLLGVAGEGSERWLTRMAPVSLRPLDGRRMRLRAPLEAWALSPDDKRLAVVTERATELRFVDVDRMREAGRVRTFVNGAYASVVWSRRDRLWIVVSDSGCCAVGATTVVTVNASAWRVIARRRLDGGLARVAASRNGPVLLLAPSTLIGPARLVSVDAGGAVEQLQLDGVSAGLMPTEFAPSVERVRTPGLAVDPDARRAYVVSAAPYVIEADLRQRSVDAHRLVPRTGLGDRLRQLIEPDAQASTRVGAVRDALWLGDGRIAFSGSDNGAVWRPNEGLEALRRPAGLHVIDTRDWQVRTLDERASTFVAAGGVVLTGNDRGLTAYAPGGGERFRVLHGRRVEIVASAGSLVYVRTPPEPRLRVVDVVRGRVLGTGSAALPLGRSSAARR
jgi:hypothetical protein